MRTDDKFEDETMEETAFGRKIEKHGTTTAEHKIMTMEDVSECLQKDFAEEISDAKKYLCMAKVADDAEAHHDSHYLLEMAKDEYTHATFIHDFMERHSLHIPEEQEAHYCKLKEEMARFF